MQKRFTEAQIVGFLREADAGMPVRELCRKHGFSDASYYLWRSKFGGMSVPDAKRLKELEIENTRLKKLLAECQRGDRDGDGRRRAGSATWSITSIPDPCAGSPTPGTTCANGSEFAGYSAVAGTKVYITPTG